jgi:hypothetical protein
MNCWNSTLTALALGLAPQVLAQSNVDSVNKFAWCENVGWTNWRDANGTNDGVIVGTDFLEGFIWGENAGWINVGGGGPYANTTGLDFGVNILVDDDLDGFAWGENIGWINFGWGAAADDADRARFDFAAGRFRGFAWGENIGWINLDDATHFVAAGVPISCLTDVDCVVLDANTCTCDQCIMGECVSTPTEFGNSTCDAGHNVDVGDILCVLDGFAEFALCPNGDLAPPCTGDDNIDVGDVLAVLDAFAGIDSCGCVP